MEPFQSIGKIILIIGLLLVVVGGLMLGLGKFFNLGKLPGDIYVQKGNFTFFFPVATMIVLSLLLTILMNIFFRK